MNNRIYKFDVARASAILCVILCHSVENIYDLSSKCGDAGRISKLFMISSFTVGRLGVPIFLFLSGALLLKKQIEEDSDVFTFYKRNWLPLFIANEIWVVIYNIYFCFTGQFQHLTFNNITRELLCLETVPSPQMWYLPMILGMYLGIPFVAKIVKTFSLKSLVALMCAIFAINSFLPTLQMILNIAGVKFQCLSLVSVEFLGGMYGLYIVVGYFVANKNAIKLKSIWVCMITLVCFFLTVLMQFISRSDLSQSEILYNVWYDNFFLSITALGVFVLFNRINDSRLNEKFSGACTYISKISLSLFFVHYIFINLFKNTVIRLNIANSLKVIILFISAFLTSTVVSFLLSKIKAVSKYALIIKK